MNLEQIQVDYLSPSRTIETYSATKDGISDLFYIYNYEGFHFRFFKDSSSLDNFFSSGIEPEYAFEDEGGLDIFLKTINV